MTATQQTTAPATYTFKGRDSYGRSTVTTKVGNRTVAIVTTMPKAHREAGNGSHYVTDLTTGPMEPGTNCYSQAQVRTAVAAIIASVTA